MRETTESKFCQKSISIHFKRHLYETPVHRRQATFIVFQMQYFLYHHAKNNHSDFKKAMSNILCEKCDNFQQVGVTIFLNVGINLHTTCGNEVTDKLTNQLNGITEFKCIMGYYKNTTFEKMHI